LFALAAAAGQALRSDPTMIRRLTHSFDGVRRSGGAPGSGGGTPVPTYATNPPPESPAPLPDRYEMVSGHGFETITSDAYPTNPGFSVPDGAFSQGNGLAQGAQGIGGQAGGADHLAKGANGGLNALANGNADLLATGMPNGLESANVGVGQVGTGYDVAANASSHGPNLQADALGSPGTEAASSGPADPRISSGHSGNQIGGGHGGDMFARGVGSSGHEFANGLSPSGQEAASNLNVSGHEIAQGSGFAPDHGTLSAAQGGGLIGGSHGSVGGDLFAKVPTPQAAGMPPSPAVTDIALGGTSGAEADLADSLDALARSVSSGAVVPPVDAGATAAADGATMASPAFDPAWLSAGALARADHQEPLPRVFRCPACRKRLVYGHRFCGYCGEPLDKTMA
jgi:hypothetical protein